MGGRVESPQGADTPGVAEGPRGNKTPGGTTAAQDRHGEDRQGRGGGEKNPPTARATRMQGYKSGDGTPKGGQQTAEPTGTMETAEDDGSAGPRKEQSDGVNGARSKNSALARREYNILALKATEGGQAIAGTAGGDDGHGALAYQEITGTEEEGDKTPAARAPHAENRRRKHRGEPPPRMVVCA